ncbi:uncharacterized protein VP01_1925g3 [Puccinia sorghi]|uniref:Uncharacterized protein n=1 Tax=Puccinia sorghi TaxID=27349 RepID=A0A0L6VED6_9BASI|nr:uncharacterized protein VP01_1925g3 [Puccinia sorghi]
MGQTLWEEFILSQAVEVVCHQKPPNGVYPMGLYHNSRTIEDSFFTPSMQLARNKALIDWMPFPLPTVEGQTYWV